MLPSSSDPTTSGPADVSLPIPILSSKGHSSTVWAVAFSPDGERLYSAGNDKVVRVWDVESGEEAAVSRIPRWTGADGNIYALDSSPDGRFLAAAGCQGCSGKWAKEHTYVAYLIDTETLEIVGTALARASVHSLAFSPDGRHLAIGGWDGQLRVFRVDPDDGLVEEAILPGHGAEIASLAWEGDRRGIYTAGHDGLLVAWRRFR